ncbi:unnamed protein product [Amoebophrya sp. A25]|nr:unnamed protein product [Amoebophrya sp. A25]|eukprot:GSA25T00001353001.1
MELFCFSSKQVLVLAAFLAQLHIDLRACSSACMIIVVGCSSVVEAFSPDQVFVGHHDEKIPASLLDPLGPREGDTPAEAKKRAAFKALVDAEEAKAWQTIEEQYGSISAYIEQKDQEHKDQEQGEEARRRKLTAAATEDSSIDREQGNRDGGWNDDNEEEWNDDGKEEWQHADDAEAAGVGSQGVTFSRSASTSRGRRLAAAATWPSTSTSRGRRLGLAAAATPADGGGTPTSWVAAATWPPADGRDYVCQTHFNSHHLDCTRNILQQRSYAVVSPSCEVAKNCKQCLNIAQGSLVFMYAARCSGLHGTCATIRLIRVTDRSDAYYLLPVHGSLPGVSYGTVTCGHTAKLATLVLSYALSRANMFYQAQVGKANATTDSEFYQHVLPMSRIYGDNTPMQTPMGLRTFRRQKHWRKRPVMR